MTEEGGGVVAPAARIYSIHHVSSDICTDMSYGISEAGTLCSSHEGCRAPISRTDIALQTSAGDEIIQETSMYHRK